MLIDDLTTRKLKQDNPKSLDYAFEKTWKSVEKYCSDVLIEYRNAKRVLYRGVKKDSPDIFIGQPREHRKVVNQSEIGQTYAELCDLYLKTAGFEALRLSSIFCNANPRNATNWGYLFVIFPMNGFKFTWSLTCTGMPAYNYLYDHTATFMSQYSNNSKFFKKESQKFIKENNFDHTHFSAALKSSNDIWFTGRYIAFQVQGNIFGPNKVTGINFRDNLEEKLGFVMPYYG